MSANTFRVPQTQTPLHFIPYNGPPEPKPSSKRPPFRIPFSEDGARPNAERENTADLIPTLDEVELVDLTYLSEEEGNCEISGSGGGESGDVGSVDGFPPINEWEGIVPTYPDDTGDEASSQPAPSESSSQVIAAVIEDSHFDSDTDEGGSHEYDASTQMGDQVKVSSMATTDGRGSGCSTDTEDVIMSDVVEDAKAQMSGLLPRRKFPSTLPTSSSQITIEQSTQSSLPTIENTSSSSSDTDDNDNDDRGNQTAWLTCKRKRFPSTSTKRHIRSSNTTSKQRPHHNARSAKQRKLFPSSEALKPLSASLYGDDSSDDSNENRVRHLESNKRPMTTLRPRSRKHKRKHNRGTTDEDDEYEVVEILNARIYRRKLQYRVKWLGYKEDPEWYDASNFKNSPHRLQDFHAANPLCVSPPRRLKMWIQCWEEDRDVGNYPDDSKPEG